VWTGSPASRPHATPHGSPPEVRQLAERLGVYLAPDHELRELCRTHRFDDDPAELRELADALGVNLDE
jgi:hypothetical protein